MMDILSPTAPTPTAPDCNFIIMEPISYFVLFFGAGIGWFIAGYILTDSCYRCDRPNQVPILAETIN